MKIPMGNFGQVVAQPQQQVQFPGRDPIGPALANVGQALGGAVESMQQAELQKQRSQAGAALATLSNGGYDLSDQIGRDIAEGKIPANQGVPEFRKRMGDLVGANTKDFTVDQRSIIDEHLIKSSGMHERNLAGIGIKRTQSETGANLLNMGEQFQRAAMRDLPGSIDQYSKAVDAMGPAAGWDPDKIVTAKNAFREGATFNFANATLEGAAQTGNADLVRAAREKIEGPDGEPLDPARRTALITKAYGIENGIAAAGVRDAEKLKREAEARENKAGDSYKDMEQHMLNGRYFSTEDISAASLLTAGTSYALPLQNLVKSQAEVAGFAALPVSQQRTIIEQRRAAGSTPGVGISMTEEKKTDYMERVTSATEKGYATDPWKTAPERGVIPQSPDIKINDITSGLAVISERMKVIDRVEAAAEQKISPLKPEEAETFGRLVQSLPPDQQSNALASIGGMINNGDRMAAFARQIDAKDKVLATAMMVADLQTSQGRNVAELVLKGSRALKDKTIAVDGAKETGWRAAIANEIGDAYQNQEARERMIDAAYLVQAGIASEGDGTKTSRAVRLVTGGIIDHNNSKIPLPRGMDESAFGKRLGAIKPADLAAQAIGGNVFVGQTAVPVEQFIESLPKAVLVHAGQGKYNIRAGMGLVVNAKGKRITIEVRNGN